MMTPDSDQLSNVGVTIGKNGNVQVTWTMNRPLPRTGTALLSVMVTTGGKYRIRRQIGYKVLDGVQIACFVFDYDRGVQKNLAGTATDYTSKGPANEAISVDAPAPLFEGLPAWDWWAVYNVDGTDVQEWNSDGSNTLSNRAFGHSPDII